MIKDNITRIQKELAEACQKANRDPSEVSLIAVTKFNDAYRVKEAIDAGVKHIGENRVQEAQEKLPQLEKMGVHVVRHMIGHLQTNKVKFVVPLFDMIQSVDRLSLAQEIEKHCAKINKTMDILIEINSGEEQKEGVSPDKALALIEEILSLPHLHIKGLMTMAPYTDNQELVRSVFRNLRLLRDEITQKFGTKENIEMKYLSMGMSADYKIAIEEGANMIRIGTAIFGARQYV